MGYLPKYYKSLMLLLNMQIPDQMRSKYSCHRSLTGIKSALEQEKIGIP